MSVIEVKNPKVWYMMTMLKNNIAFMQRLDPNKYSDAIDKEKSLLRSFFDAILKRDPEAPSTAEAA